MRFQGALIKEQGQTFAIVIVKPQVIQLQSEANKAREAFTTVFSNMPIILMAQNGRGIPTYQGRPDIVKFLANINPGRIPWKEYSYA
jgi:hypothetical protein